MKKNNCDALLNHSILNSHANFGLNSHANFGTLASMLGGLDVTKLISQSEQDYNLLVVPGPNTHLSDVAAVTMNPYLGISLGNRVFIPRDDGSKTQCVEYIRDCLRWGLRFSRNGQVLAIIGDSIHAINLQYADGYTEARAKKVAARKGQEAANIVRAAIKLLPSADQGKASIAHWEPLVEMKPGYSEKLEQIRQAYATQPAFKDRVSGIVDKIVGTRSKPITAESKEGLSEYVLQELALLTGGIQIEHEGETVKFDLLMYPALGDMQQLIAEAHWPLTAQQPPAIQEIPQSETGIIFQNQYAWDTRNIDINWVSGAVGLWRPICLPTGRS